MKNPPINTLFGWFISAIFLSLINFCLKPEYIGVPTTVSFNKLQNSQKNEDELIKNQQSESANHNADSDSRPKNTSLIWFRIWNASHISYAILFKIFLEV